MGFKDKLKEARMRRLFANTIRIEAFAVEDNAFAFLHGLHVGAGVEYCGGKIAVNYPHQAEHEDTDTCDGCAFELGVQRASGCGLTEAEFIPFDGFRIRYRLTKK